MQKGLLYWEGQSCNQLRQDLCMISSFLSSLICNFHFCHNNYALHTFALLVSLMSVWFWYHITCRADCVPAFTIHDVSCHCMQRCWRLLFWELHYDKCLTVLCLCSAGSGGKKWFSIFGKWWTYKWIWRSGRNDPGKCQRVHLPLFFYNHPPEPATRYT